MIDTEKMLADIEWDILEKKSKLGVAKLNVYKSDTELEILLLFAASTFLVFQHYLQTEKMKNYVAMSFWTRQR